MKILPTLLIPFACCFALSSCSEEETGTSIPKPMPETLVNEFDDSEMDQAIQRSRETRGEFIKVLGSGEADTFAVKVRVADGDDVEHFWMTDITYEDGKFSGVINNEPGLVTNVKFGQKWTVKEAEISDWMFTRGEKIHGGFTIEPLLHSYSPEEAAAMRARLVR